MVDRRSILAHPRRTVLIAAVLGVILASSSIYAYYRSLPSQRGPMVSVRSPPFELWLELSKTTFVLGENVSVKLGLKNVSNENITALWADYAIYYPPAYKDNVPPGKRALLDFLVFDENETKVFQLVTLRYFSVFYQTFAPGEELTFAFDWDMKNFLTYELVSKGTYSAMASSRDIGLGDYVSVRLDTQTLSFEIT